MVHRSLEQDVATKAEKIRELEQELGAMRQERENDRICKKDLEAWVQELEKAASQAERDENARYSSFVEGA